MDGEAERPIAERYDAIFLDLDGTVYRGDRAVAGAAGALTEIRRRGLRRLFMTNNSSRTPDEVAGHLSQLGIEAEPGEVLTSALATASFLGREGRSGSTAFVIGERGIRDALGSAGIQIVDGEPETADLVVVGLDRFVDYGKLRRASLLVERGARLVATNDDGSYPAADGLWPGAGALLAAVTTTTGATPSVVGKPARPMFEAAAEWTGATRPLVVGDRLDTDIRGAGAMDWDSLLVLTGAAGPRDLLAADDLPTYVGSDLSAMLAMTPPARFRPARPSDVTAVRHLLTSAGLSADGVEERIEDTIVSMADEEAGLDGAACLEPARRGRRVDAILRSVAVRSAVRGEGLGILAVASAIRLARRHRASTVSLFTTSAAPFFERLGFRPVDRRELPASVRESRHAAEECAESATPMLLRLGHGPDQM